MTDYLDLTSIFFTSDIKEKRKNLLHFKKIEDETAVFPNPKSAIQDPFIVLSTLSQKGGMDALPYDILRRLAQYDSLLSAIINTRISQVLNFSKPKEWSTNPYSFDLIPTEGELDTKLRQDTISFLLKMGFLTDWYRDDFVNFLKKLVRDRLRYDQINFEIVYNKDKLPVAVYVVDPATIRLFSSVDPEYNQGYQTFQLIRGEKTARFKPWEMCWGVYNVRSDGAAAGYGFSEIEQALHILASKTYAEEYNKYYFLQGGSKGLLFVKKNVLSRQQMSGFMEEWQAAMAGYNQAHRIPVLSSPSIDDVRYVSIDRTNKEMEFSRWIDYCVNVLCAVFTISPQEINFPPRGLSGTGGVLQTEGTYAQIIKHSRDKGLRPLLYFLESIINKYIIYPLTGEKLTFVFKGLDDLSPKEKIDQIYRSVTSFKTINEVRVEENLPEIDGGDIVLNPIYFQAKMAAGFPMEVGAPPPAEEGEK